MVKKRELTWERACGAAPQRPRHGTVAAAAAAAPNHHHYDIPRQCSLWLCRRPLFEPSKKNTTDVQCYLFITPKITFPIDPRISPVRVIFFTAKRHHRVIPAIGEVTRISGISVSHSEAAYTNSDKMQTTAFRVILITPMLFICMLSRGHGMGRDFLCCLRKSKNIEFFLDYLLVISSSNC